MYGFGIVTKATRIEFWPMDNNIGISGNMLLQIRKLCDVHKCELHMWHDYIHYTWTEKRVLPNAEIKQMVDGIREICKGIELIFKITNTVPAESVCKRISPVGVDEISFPIPEDHEISIEEIDALNRI